MVTVPAVANSTNFSITTTLVPDTIVQRDLRGFVYESPRGENDFALVFVAAQLALDIDQ